MTDERAKEIAERLRVALSGGESCTFEWRDSVEFTLKLYDDIQSIKASMGGLAFLNAGIQPIKRTDG